MMRIETKESRLVKELTSTVANIVLPFIFIYTVILAERSVEEDLSR